MTKVQAELDETKVILVSGQHLAINMEIARYWYCDVSRDALIPVMNKMLLEL